MTLAEAIRIALQAALAAAAMACALRLDALIRLYAREAPARERRARHARLAAASQVSAARSQRRGAAAQEEIAAAIGRPPARARMPVGFAPPRARRGTSARR